MKHRHTHGSVSIDHVVDMLNEILAIDPVALSELGRLSVPCNKKLAEHPTVQVRATAGKHDYRVGLLGILNGVLSKSSPGIIQAIVDDEDDNKLLRFQVNTNAEAATAKYQQANNRFERTNMNNLEAMAAEIGGSIVRAAASKSGRKEAMEELFGKYASMFILFGYVPSSNGTDAVDRVGLRKAVKTSLEMTAKPIKRASGQLVSIVFTVVDRNTHKKLATRIVPDAEITSNLLYALREAYTKFVLAVSVFEGQR